MPKKYEKIGDFIVTRNSKERTYSIYNLKGEFLSTVDDGELMAEIRELENERAS